MSLYGRELELKRLAELVDGVDHRGVKDGMAYRAEFTGTYEHRVLDGIGHNVPREAPEAFSRAVLDVATR